MLPYWKYAASTGFHKLERAYRPLCERAIVELLKNPNGLNDLITKDQVSIKVLGQIVAKYLPDG